MKAVHATPPYLSKIYFNIILPPSGTSSGLIILAFPLKPCMLPLLSHSCYMPCPSHPRHYRYNFIWRGVKAMNLLVMQFSPVSYYFIPLGSKFLLSTVFSNTLSLCPLLISETKFHTHKNFGTYKIISAVQWDKDVNAYPDTFQSRLNSCKYPKELTSSAVKIFQWIKILQERFLQGRMAGHFIYRRNTRLLILMV
jgi:hypothetical protein